MRSADGVLAGRERVPGLLAITPPASTLPVIDAAVVDAWLDAGAAELGLAVLLREPGSSPAQLLADPRLGPLREALARRKIATLLSVDAGCDPALIAAAHPALAGVQLRGDPPPEACARWRAALPDATLGRSCHGSAPRPEPAVDYTCLAPVFAPRTEQPGVVKQAIGLPALRRWADAVPRVFALGGVDPDNAAACLAAGAWGIAGISLFFGESAAAHHNVAALRQVFVRVEAGLRSDDHAPQARQRR